MVQAQQPACTLPSPPHAERLPSAKPAWGLCRALGCFELG